MAVSLRRWTAWLCSRLPRAYGLAGFVLCCVLPCRCLEPSPKQSQQDLGSRKVLLLGFDGAGKSAFLWLAEHPTATQLPAERLLATQGAARLTRKVQITAGLLELDLCEVGGSETLRKYWQHYVTKDVRCIAFFVDCTTEDRLEEAIDAVAALPVRKLLLVGTCQASRAGAGAGAEAPQAPAPRLARLADVQQRLKRRGLEVPGCALLRFTRDGVDQLLQELATVAA
ncbi:unnamed protein product [Durusdinium trenchii]|uniref:Uncharacterized protein n=2 Tax=Durusdinium trenchii TaxID=1381693 RepID=A0ABP0T0Y2_9DINO